MVSGRDGSVKGNAIETGFEGDAKDKTTWPDVKK
jgi:hypothetical protein